MHLARRLLLVAALAAAAVTPLRAEPSATVTPLLQPFVDRHELAGAVALVINRERVLDLECVGFADIAAQKPMTPDTLFWIASQTKPMTATAVLMLVDEGKLALDDAVEKYLPEFRGQLMVAPVPAGAAAGSAGLRAPSRPITIRDVLSHMSGLPFQSALEKPTLDGLPLAAAVRSYAKTPLQWEPGTRYQYSNAGINTAARILEVVSGMPYERFMQRRLFGPLGMKDTTFWPTEKQARRIAKSYRPDASMTGLGEFPISQLQYPLSDRKHRYPMPAGGLFSTASDTAKFCQMLLNGGELNGHRYLSHAAFGELTRRQTPPTVSDSYGLGLSAGGKWFGHGGAQATGMEIRPGDGYAVVWMVQHGGFPGDGGKAQGVFKDWARERFAPGK